MTSCFYDSLAMVRDFRDLRFHKVRHYENCDYSNLKQAIDDFSQGYECDSLNVIYFSGHGFNINGTDYIAATNSNIIDSKVENAISLKYILDQFKGLHSYVVLILDACRTFQNNDILPFMGLELPKDVLIAYATQIGKEAFGVSGRGLSPFTNSIHNNILRSELSFNNVFQSVRGQLNNDKYVQMSCEISTLTEVIPLTYPYVDFSDEVIYEFLMNRNNGTFMEAMMTACDLFDRSFLDLSYAFAKVSYKKLYMMDVAAPLLSEAEQKNFDYDGLPRFGAEFKNYRWYFREKEIRIGDLPRLPHSMSYQRPLEPLIVSIRLTAKREDDFVIINFRTNLPVGFVLMVSFPVKSAYSRLIEITGKNTIYRIHHSEIDIGHDNSFLVSISSARINNTNPTAASVGENGRNLVGELVEFSSIIGNVIRYEKRITLDE